MSSYNDRDKASSPLDSEAMSSDDEEEDDEDFFTAESLAKRGNSRGNNKKTTKAPAKRKTEIIDAMPQSLTEGSEWTTEGDSAFATVKTAFIVESQKQYAAQLGSTYTIASSGGKNGLKINCVTDLKKEKRDSCKCTFGLTASWVCENKICVHVNN